VQQAIYGYNRDLCQPTADIVGDNAVKFNNAIQFASATQKSESRPKRLSRPKRFKGSLFFGSLIEQFDLK
jgi:hypothetical protein